MHTTTTDSTTEILSNGSHMAGSGPSTIEELCTALTEYPLDRTFEEYGNFISPDDQPGRVRFFGNFLTLSHVFNIRTNDPALIERLTNDSHSPESGQTRLPTTAVADRHSQQTAG